MGQLLLKLPALVEEIIVHCGEQMAPQILMPDGV